MFDCLFGGLFGHRVVFGLAYLLVFGVEASDCAGVPQGQFEGQ